MSEKAKTACFSGYRPEKFSFPLCGNNEKYLGLVSRVRDAVKQAAEGGYGTFLCGMAAGFDLMCGDVALKLKEETQGCSRLRLVAVRPFPEHDVPDPWKDVYRFVMDRADERICVSGGGNHRGYRARNRYMVDRSSLLICYYDGQPGGTAHTVGYAQKNGLLIVNLHQ
jgi:uncharacterized phage-like protein YoqJ